MFLASNTIEWTMNDLLQLNNNQISQQQQQVQSMCNEIDVKNNNQNSVSNQNAIAMPQQVQQQLMNVPKIKERPNTNKRPSLTSESNSKRIKGHDASKQPSTTSCTSATPQLLHQLMAPTTSASQKSRSKSRWTSGLNGKSQQQQQTASNSVLMNLLVSGCDVSAGYTCFPRPKVAKA